jgi:hypothetical protein
MEPPRYKHDCELCKYLGRYGKHDLYYCPGGWSQSETIIARYSSEGPDYISGLVFAEDFAPLTVARDRAKEKGLLCTQ